MHEEISGSVKVAIENLKKFAKHIPPASTIVSIVQNTKTADKYYREVLEPYETRKYYVREAYLGLQYAKNEINSLKPSVQCIDLKCPFKSKDDFSKGIKSLEDSVENDDKLLEEKTGILSGMQNIFNEYFKPESYKNKDRIELESVGNDLNDLFSRMKTVHKAYQTEHDTLEKEFDKYVHPIRTNVARLGAEIVLVIVAGALGQAAYRSKWLAKVTPKLAKLIKAKIAVG